MKLNHLTLPLLGLLLAGLGYGAGRWHQTKLTIDAPSVRPSLGAQPSRSPKQKKPEVKPPVPPAAKVADLLTKGTTGSELVDGIAAWADADGPAALEAFLADPRLQTADIARRLFASLARKDPAGAMELLQRLPRKPWNAIAYKAVATAWADQDPAAAMKAGLTLEQGSRRRDFISAAYHGWLKGDILAAAGWLKNLPEGENARSIIGKEHLFLGGMSGDNAAERMTALLQVHRLAGEDQNTWLWHDFSHWSSRDPQNAIAWAMQLPEDAPKRDDIMKTTFERLANDPAKACALLPTLTNEKDRETLASKTAETWGRSDPHAALAWAQTLTGATKENALEQVSRSWVQTDPETAVAYLQQHNPAQMATWGSAAAQAWGASAPEQALSWLKTVPQELKEDFTAQTLQGMSREDPAKALDNLSLLTTESQRKQFLETSVRQLAKDDITQASTRVSQMASSPERDSAICGLLDPAYEVEPDSALVWATSMQNDSERKNRTRSLFQRWHESDAPAAEAWLQRTNLDEKLRESLNSFIKK
jgi:hypothetical protein